MAPSVPQRRGHGSSPGKASMKILSLVLPAAGLVAFASAGFAQSNPWSPNQTTVPIEVQVLPMAAITFPNGTGGLHLYVPPANSTIPSSGLLFEVLGNASASVTAAPSEFVFVQQYILNNNINLGSRFLGKASLPNGEMIGYNLQMEFPIGQFSAPNGMNGIGASSPPVNIAAAGGMAPGFLHLLASHRWTPNGGMPSVGDYTGDIVVTVVAGN